MGFEIHQILILVLVAIFLIGPARIFGFLSGLSIFMYAQTAMGLGIIPFLDPSIDADRVHGRVILVTLAIYVLTATIAAVVKSTYSVRSGPIIRVFKPQSGTWILLALSVVISSLYFMAVGYVAFLETLRSTFAGSEVDAAGLRLESYSGSNYYFPGYVNQFKNSLLPALVVLIVHYLFSSKAVGRLPISLTLITLAALFLLGTGQRGAFVKFVMIIVLYILIVNRKRFKFYTLGIGFFAIILFFLSTAASGRASNELEAATSTFERTTVLFGQLIFRVTGSNQESAAAGFRYIYEQPVQYGGDWLKALLGLLPGVSGSDLDQQIFANIYGSTRGTAPPSVWGSVYYNFGEIGCILFAIAFALFLVKVSTLGGNPGELNTFQVIGFAGINVITGSWIAGSPVYLFNFGLVIYILLWRYGTRRMKIDQKNHTVVDVNSSFSRGRSNSSPAL